MTIWKRKGLSDVCRDSKGDAISKIPIGLLKQRVHMPYTRFVPNMQCGVVVKRGSGHCWPVGRTKLATAEVQRTSICVVFLDVEKALDFAIRELMECPQHDVGDEIKFLINLGLDRSRARLASDLIDSGENVLSMCDSIDPCFSQQSWAKIGDLETVMWQHNWRTPRM